MNRLLGTTILEALLTTVILSMVIAIGSLVWPMVNHQIRTFQKGREDVNAILNLSGRLKQDVLQCSEISLLDNGFSVKFENGLVTYSIDEQSVIRGYRTIADTCLFDNVEFTAFFCGVEVFEPQSPIDRISIVATWNDHSLAYIYRKEYDAVYLTQLDHGS